MRSVLMISHAPAELEPRLKDNGPELDLKAMCLTIAKGKELERAGWMRQEIASSPLTRAQQTAHNLGSFTCVNTDLVLSEVSTELDRLSIGIKLYEGDLPEEFRYAGRVLLKKLPPEDVQVTHRGTIGGVLDVVRKGEFPDITAAPVDINGGVVRDQELQGRNPSNPSLLVGNLGCIMLNIK